VTASLVATLFVAGGLTATGVVAAARRRDLAASLAGVPLLLGGAGIAFAGVARFSARAAAAVQPPSVRVVVGVSGPPYGQEVAVLLAIAALALVALGIGLAGRVARSQTGSRESRR
jgi:hypothetical protein